MATLDTPTATAPRSWWLRALVVAGLAGAALLALRQLELGPQIASFAQWVDGLGALGPAVFVAGYALAVVALVPGSLLTLAGGAIFGLAAGTAWVFAGAFLGSALSFLVARYLARRTVERRLAGNPRFAAVDRAIGREGRKIVFLLRLSPLFPFSLLNYALGLTRVRLADYLLASLGMLPGTLLYVYYGKVLGDVAAVAAGAAVERGPEYWLALGLGLAATVAVTALVTRVARRALASEVSDAPR